MNDDEDFEPLLSHETDDIGFPNHPPKLKKNSNICDKMRKYYKLFMIVVTLVSVVCLLFYKTQYEKLYKVLEVLEFFGNDVQSKDGSFQCSTKGYLPWTPPAFQRINNGHFIYSAFCTPSLDVTPNICGFVVALSVVKPEFSGDKLRCRLW